MRNSWNGGANDNWLPAQVPVQSVARATCRCTWVSTRVTCRHYLLAITFTACDGYFARFAGQDHAQPPLLDERRPRRH